MAPRNRADVHRRLALLARDLFPLFPSMAAGHHLDAAESLASFGLWQAALEQADQAELLATEDCGAGEHILPRARAVFNEATKRVSK